LICVSFYSAAALSAFPAAQNIPHSAEAISVAQYTAAFLVAEARRSNHTFTDEDLQTAIIWNYSPAFSGKDGASSFDQSYFFDYDSGS